MKKLFIALTLLLLSANASLAEWQLFPAFYDVTGVASNDTLNVRSGIGTKHPITHKLKHNQRYVEIIRLSDNGRWGLIGYPEGSGWASMRFLTRQPNQNGNDVPRPISCGGNEPFWGLSLDQNENVFSTPSSAPKSFSTIWQGIPNGMLAISYGIKMANGPEEINAIIRRTQCSDGMSEMEYGFEINVLISDYSGHQMYHGCCSLVRP